MQFEPVIGLEVHVQLKTDTKIFCSCPTVFGAEPNSQVCPVCLGMPGVLPVLNDKVLEYATRLALATHSKINEYSIFARKNYFYPDLPKAYQISQFEEPFCEHGHLQIHVEGQEPKKIGITRIHLEEDAGKSLHTESFVGRDESLVDVNRCGVPLAEIVSDPDFRSPQEAFDYLVRLRQIVRFLGVCDGNMEEGSFRCDANISLRPVGETKLGTKTELKNMNSFRAVEKALEYEIHRQELVLEGGGEIVQQTLLWDANRNVAEAMRSKEESHDYRYFPDPDLVPFYISKDYIENIKSEMPELPNVMLDRFINEYGLPEYDAQVLTETPELALYFEKVATAVSDKKLASNWVMGQVLRALKEKSASLSELEMTVEKLVVLLKMLEKCEISARSAKTVFDRVVETGGDPKIIVEKEGLAQVTDMSAIEPVIDKVLEDNPAEVESFIGGNAKVVGFFMGQIMRATGGKADPKSINSILMKKLNEKK